MPDVSFTDTLTVRTISSTIGEEEHDLYARASFDVTAPISAWLDHSQTEAWFDCENPRIEPVFYLPGPDPALSAPQRYLVRGALETLAEESWEAYTALLEAGVSPQLARAVLPSHTMITQTVSASALTLSRFVARNRNFTPGNEIAVIAGGYAAHLAERAPHLLHPVRTEEEKGTL